MTLVFTEPDILHPNSETTTIYDVARMLESKYGVCESFFKKNEQFIKEQCKTLALMKIFDKKGEIERKKNTAQERIKARWREFILDGEVDIITRAAMRREDPSFVDTGSYYLNMGVEIQL